MLYGIDLMNSGRAAILAYTMPLWATLTGAFCARLSGRVYWPGNARWGCCFSPGWRGIPSRPALGDRRRDVLGAGTALVKYYNFTMPLTVTIAATIGVTPILVVVLFRDLDHPASFLAGDDGHLQHGDPLSFTGLISRLSKCCRWWFPRLGCWRCRSWGCFSTP